MGTWERGCSLISMPAPERPRPLCAWPAHNHSLCGGLAPALALALAPALRHGGCPNPPPTSKGEGRNSSRQAPCKSKPRDRNRDLSLCACGGLAVFAPRPPSTQSYGEKP